MGRAVLTCRQCAAPHRPARGQTRFTCDWCGAENEVGESARVEELVATGSCDAQLAVRRAREVLGRRGIRSPSVRSRSVRWLPMWQIFSESGDEFVTSGLRRPARLLASMRPPAAHFVAAAEAVDAVHAAPEIDLEEATAAARASFADGDAPLQAVRLLWIEVCDLELRTSAGRVSGLYVAGSDEVLFEPLPATVFDPPPRPWRVLLFACFALTAMVAGVLIDDAVRRAFFLAAWCAAGLALSTFGNRVGRKWTA